MNALKLGRIWATAPTSPNIDPGTAKWKLGWVAEIPVFQMLNYINNRHDTNVVALAERGSFEWGADVTYNIGALAWDEVDGSIYISKVLGPSTTLRPGANAAQWDKSSVQISRVQYDLAVTNWNNHVANTSNPHQLTTEILNTYSKAVIDGKVAVVQSGLNTHAANTQNIHNVTATQAGAVPVTGGSYTGLVRHLFASTGIGPTSFAATLLTNSTGTFLTLGSNSKIGLDSNNNAVFVNDLAVKSNLLIESNYIAARETVEALYVTPTPDFEVQFRNSLNFIHGSGTANFTGPAGSRGYLDKSGTAQTALLNTPRYTAQGLYITGVVDTESLTLPTSLNLLKAPSYTICIDFQSTESTIFIYWASVGPNINTAVATAGGTYRFTSVVNGASTSMVIAPVDHTVSHKICVVSDAALNKTFVYFDGVLKVTIASKQDIVIGPTVTFSNAGNSYGANYLNSFRTWLYALTPQQVSNT